MLKIFGTSKLKKTTIYNIGILLTVTNGFLFYYTYTTVKKNRPPFLHIDPPTEKHRISIFDNLASTYDSSFDSAFEKYGILKAKKILLKKARGHVLDVCSEKERPEYPVVILCDDVKKIPFEDSSFNTVVSTHSLCSVEDPEALISEIDRVMKPSAKFLSIERGKIYYYPIRKLMELLEIYPNDNVPWKYGYYENRDPMSSIYPKLEISKYGIFGYGINYSILARKRDKSPSNFSENPQILSNAKVFHTYTPQH
ncbi:uncharacterized protein TA04405 [Theileria annulata]|uniref:Methyltransferase type 11 domain-containing protein n=1 Tax=Theileria annulata TaxID=5874 RepID=Q4UC29_THEAN|nr:uncharacterized protein TA04405 [Theileria annulata]CAI75622.1 hypothetical protein, conserved [Theileria annulata]|eukprot:XP_955098.1 hypothetical protein, conserved [Theileria annulata]